jgi:anti-sigma-K factor RskA
MSNFLIDEDTDLLAAEFVLGTLDSEERANAQSLLRTDHGFIAMVRIWERRFGELHLMVEPVEPDAKILQRIKAKIAELPPRAPVPEAKLLAGVTASPPPPEPSVTPDKAEMPAPPADGSTPVAALPSQDSATPEATKLPAEVAVAGEAEKPPDTAPAGEPTGEEVATALAPGGAEQPVAVEVQPEPEPQSQELAAKSDPEPSLKPAVAPAPVLPKPSEKPQRQLAIRRPEIIGEVIRSRGRWRAAAAAMSLVVVGLVALLAAWKFVPDRLPAGLRPAPVLMSLGIQALPNAAPEVKRPPASAFDE